MRRLNEMGANLLKIHLNKNKLPRVWRELSLKSDQWMKTQCFHTALFPLSKTIYCIILIIKHCVTVDCFCENTLFSKLHISLILSYTWPRCRQKRSWAVGLMCVIQHGDDKDIKQARCNARTSNPTKSSVFQSTSQVSEVRASSHRMNTAWAVTSDWNLICC